MKSRRRQRVLLRWWPILLLGAPVVAHDAATKIRGEGTAAARLAAGMSVVQAGTASRPVVYDIRLVNEGAGDQPDDPASDELVDVLPPELALRTADADRGAISVDLAGNVVRWNGALAAGAPPVKIRIEADVVATRPMTIRNQATISWDSDGDGRNDRSSLSTDPSQPGDAVPTVFHFPGIVAMPGAAQPVPSLHRDPRQVLASMMEAWESGGLPTYPNLPGWTGLPWSLLLVPGWRELVGKPLPQIVATQWETTTRILLDDLEALAPERRCVACYDALLADPGSEIARTCAAIGFGWDQALDARLPLANHTVSPPHADKWRQREADIIPMLERMAATVERASRIAQR